MQLNLYIELLMDSLMTESIITWNCRCTSMLESPSNVEEQFVSMFSMTNWQKY